jgi:hypothetical protein
MDSESASLTASRTIHILQTHSSKRLLIKHSVTGGMRKEKAIEHGKTREYIKIVRCLT